MELVFYQNTAERKILVLRDNLISFFVAQMIGRATRNNTDAKMNNSVFLFTWSSSRSFFSCFRSAAVSWRSEDSRVSTTKPSSQLKLATKKKISWCSSLLELEFCALFLFWNNSTSFDSSANLSFFIKKNIKISKTKIVFFSKWTRERQGLTR